jgi:hypothetical protein
MAPLQRIVYFRVKMLTAIDTATAPGRDGFRQTLSFGPRREE